MYVAMIATALKAIMIANLASNASFDETPAAKIFSAKPLSGYHYSTAIPAYLHSVNTDSV
jgi:hypothetical protein